MRSKGVTGIVLAMIVSLIAFGIVIIVLFVGYPDLFKQAQAATQTEDSIKFASEPFIDIDTEAFAEGGYRYDITISGDVQHEGDLVLRDEAFPEFDVVSLISYKGTDAKSFDVDEGDIQTFKITRDENKADISLYTVAISERPPIIDRPNPFVNQKMKKYDVFHMKDSGDFVIELSSVDENFIDLIKDPECWPPDALPKIDVFSCDAACFATFKVSCEKETEEFKLKKCKDGAGCEEFLVVCDGKVHVKINDVDCDKKEADVAIIEVEGGDEFEICEKAEVSFWADDYSSCVKKENSFEDLKTKCDKFYLGGPYPIDFCST